MKGKNILRKFVNWERNHELKHSELFLLVLCFPFVFLIKVLSVHSLKIQ